MDWLELVYDILEVCLIPLLGVATAFLVKWLKAKETETLVKADNDVADKYIALVGQTVRDCVVATNQTYVEALKKEGSFDEAAQKVAFEKTLSAVIDVLSDDAKEYLSEIYGDVTLYLTNRIEAEVNFQK